MSSTDWGEQCSVFLSPVEILQVGHLSEEEGPAQSSGMEPRPIKASSGHRAILSMPTRKRFFSLSSFAPGHLPSPPPFPHSPPLPLSLSSSPFLFNLQYSTFRGNISELTVASHRWRWRVSTPLPLYTQTQTHMAILGKWIQMKQIEQLRVYLSAWNVDAPVWKLKVLQLQL